MTTSAPTKSEVRNLADLRRHLQSLATLPVTEAPVFSVFLNLHTRPSRLRYDFNMWAIAARSTLCSKQAALFDAALKSVENALNQKWAREVRSVAIYARAGSSPMLHILPFAAPMETAFHVADMPVIFPLVQLKDRFHRFVVAISTSEYARILEITLGAVSEEILATRPEMRERIGREWTREHYNQHKHETGKRFIKEQVEIIRGLMSKRGMNHLILSGPHLITSELREALPKNIKSRVADELYHSPTSPDCPHVLEEAIAAFIDIEEDESRSTVEQLHERIRSNGLAVVGAFDSRHALEIGAADELIICESLPDHEREELVRMATAQGLPVEVCTKDPLLDEHGGVGCLLRYQPYH